MAEPSELAWLDSLFAQICRLKHAHMHPASETAGPTRGQPLVPEALRQEESKMDTEQNRRMGR